MGTEETTHHIFQGRDIDQRTSSTETVSFESQSIRTTQHVTHCMDTTRRHRAWYNVLVDFSMTLMRRSRRAVRRRSVKARIPGDVLRCAGHNLVLQWRHVPEVGGTLYVICLLEQRISEQLCCFVTWQFFSDQFVARTLMFQEVGKSEHD